MAVVQADGAQFMIVAVGLDWGDDTPTLAGGPGMIERVARGTVAGAMILILVAACGGSSTPSPSVEPSASTTPTQAPATPTEAPVATDVPASPAGTTDRSAACAGVSIRKKPATTGSLVVRVPMGAVVRVVGTVGGAAYTAGACGQAGDTWLKIDRVNGKSMKSLYGVPFGYAAAGFFE